VRTGERQHRILVSISRSRGICQSIRKISLVAYGHAFASSRERTMSAKVGAADSISIRFGRTLEGAVEIKKVPDELRVNSLDFVLMFRQMMPAVRARR